VYIPFMKRIERAIQAVQAAANAVGSLVSEAGQEQAWDEASKYVQIGRNLQELIDRMSSSDEPVANSKALPAVLSVQAKAGKKATSRQEGFLKYWSNRCSRLDRKVSDLQWRNCCRSMTLKTQAQKCQAIRHMYALPCYGRQI
jgi:hypothetical protein